MNRRTHDRLRCDICDRPALALHAYTHPWRARLWVCERCIRSATAARLPWQPVTVTRRVTP